VLDVGGSVTAYGIMSVAAGEAHLLNLCVHPNAQRLGYGRKLLGALMARAAEAGADKIFLEVRPSNQVALRLYASVGFEHIGIRPAYYQAENGREDAVILAAALQTTR
jgi:ribosomal-protein-alanine N-acetyltransferase